MKHKTHLLLVQRRTPRELRALEGCAVVLSPFEESGDFGFVRRREQPVRGIRSLQSGHVCVVHLRRIAGNHRIYTQPSKKK